MQTQSANTIDREAVARKAYELWVQGGRREGVADQNWAQAEQMLRDSAVVKVAPVVTNVSPVTTNAPAVTATKSDPPSAPRSVPAARKPSEPPMANVHGKKAGKRH